MTEMQQQNDEGKTKNDQPQEPEPSRDASVPEWLRSIAFQGDYRPQIAAPHSLEFRGTVHTVATNGHQIIAVPRDYGCEPFQPDFAPKVLGILSDESGERVPINLAALRSFLAGIIPPTSTCTRCEGKGALECEECDGEGGEECACDCGDVHTSTCRECKGSGEYTCPVCNGKSGAIVPMRLNGKLFNARLLASPPELLRGDSATLILRDHSKPTLIDGDGWRLLVMALRDERTDPIAGEFSTDVAA